MDAPPPPEDPRPFIAVAEYLCGLGLNAPTIIARDLEQGLLIIDDFGDVRLRETVDAQLDKEAEYTAAVTGLLVPLHPRQPMDALTVHGPWHWPHEGVLSRPGYC